MTVYAEPRALGEYLRQCRLQADLTLAQAGGAGRPNGPWASPTSISLLERGLRAVRLEVLERIATAVRADPVTVFRLAGDLPEEFSSGLASPKLSRALSGGAVPEETWQALRREHLANLADAYLPEATPLRVDPLELAPRAGLDMKFQRGRGWGNFETGETLVCMVSEALEDSQLDAIRTSDAERSPRLRFFMAHGIAHRLIAEEVGQPPPLRCRLEEGGIHELEREATLVASWILVPRTELGTQLPALAGPDAVKDTESISGLIQEVANLFRVPPWMAAERLAEERWLSFWAATLEAI